jgi:excisionase family DNA binding protein
VRRNLTSPEARDMAERAHVARFLDYLRPVRWAADPMNGAQCASVLGVTRAAVTQACAEGRLRHSRDGRALLISQADLRRYIAVMVRKADQLGMDVPSHARALLADVDRP